MAAIPYGDPKWERWLRELLPEKKRLGREHVPLALTYAGQVRSFKKGSYENLASNYIECGLHYYHVHEKRIATFQISDYLNHRANYDMLILYEDLVNMNIDPVCALLYVNPACLQVSDPEKVCKNLFQLLGFGDPAAVPAALRAMNEDSQGGQLSKRTHR